MNYNEIIKKIAYEFGFSYDYILDLIRQEFLMNSGTIEFFDKNINSYLLGNGSLFTPDGTKLDKCIYTIIAPLSGQNNLKQDDIESQMIKWDKYLVKDTSVAGAYATAMMPVRNSYQVRSFNDLNKTISPIPYDKRRIYIQSLYKMIEDLLKNVDQLSVEEYIVEVSRIFYRFRLIEPFVDGNNGLNRMLINYVLSFKKNCFPMAFTVDEINEIWQICADISLELEKTFSGTYTGIFTCSQNTYYALIEEKKKLMPLIKAFQNKQYQISQNQEINSNNFK